MSIKARTRKSRVAERRSSQGRRRQHRGSHGWRGSSIVLALWMAERVALGIPIQRRSDWSSSSFSSVGAYGGLLPDSGMLHPRGLEIENACGGRKLLRFTSIIVNVGAGPFKLHGESAAGASTMDTVRQRIFDDAGDSRDVDTPAIMEFDGDGHN